MNRIMNIINKDYTDKCSNLKDKQDMQVRIIKTKQSKGVSGAFRSNKDVLFAPKAKIQDFKSKRMSLSPINHMLNKISPDRLSLKASRF